MMTGHLLYASALCLAVIYGVAYCWHKSGGWPRSLIKTGAVALLALAGWVLGAPLLVLVGLALGAKGDFCLSRPGKTAFLAGLTAFGLGHLAYVALFASFADWRGLTSGFIRPALAVLVLALILSSEAWLAPHTGRLRWPVRGYEVGIAAMGLTALAVPQPDAAFGAGLFVLSDFLLALQLFRFRDGTGYRLAAVLLWPCYWFGQYFILRAALTLPNMV